ncbi:MAG: hypothetical protein J6O51_01805 [Bacteroidales bacterium]|nr:hypothetical protein [Bacteroidales bacterium]
MKTTRHYQAPRVLKEVEASLETSLLAASIVDESLEILSDGQKVTGIDASGTGTGGFDWNNNWTWE